MKFILMQVIYQVDFIYAKLIHEDLLRSENGGA